MKNRKYKLISKKKLINAVNLFESKVDAEIISIKLYGGNTYNFETWQGEYMINIGDNSVNKTYPDL